MSMREKLKARLLDLRSPDGITAWGTGAPAYASIGNWRARPVTRGRHNCAGKSVSHKHAPKVAR